MNTRKLWQFAQNSLPIIVLGYAGYMVYAYCFEFAWRRVQRDHGKGRAITLIILYSLIMAVIGITWVQILMIGPGRTQNMDRESASVPECYSCDYQGYRSWCSSCEAYKPDRAHHSGQLGRCVPKMDHYCGYLFAVIGKDNYKFFIQFLLYVLILGVYMLVTLLIYEKEHVKDQIIVLYAMVGLFVATIVTFCAVHLRFVLLNYTTIETMNYRRGIFPILNIALNSEQRIVMKLRKVDVKSKSGGPYSKGGLWANWKSVMGDTVIEWLLPIPSHDPADETINPKLAEALKQRYLNTEDGFPAPASSTQSSQEMSQVSRSSGF
jgi:palmitoyltransferase